MSLFSGGADPETGKTANVPAFVTWAIGAVLISVIWMTGCGSCPVCHPNSPPSCVEKHSPYGKKYDPWVYCYDQDDDTGKLGWHLRFGLEP